MRISKFNLVICLMIREIREMREIREKDRGCIVDAKLIDSMVYKIKKYLAVTEALIKNPDKIE